MDLWRPPTDQPHLFEWWAPLLRASRTLRQARFRWPIHLDEMMLTGRVDRGTRPSIWVYKHVESGGELYLDGSAQAYKFTRTADAKSYGRFNRCPLESAVWRAGMPTFVESVFYDEPPRRPASDTPVADDRDEECPVHGPAPSTVREPRQRRHLTVIDGGLGRPLAG